MYWPKDGVKKYPYKSWHRPDRVFFGFGACHILAGVCLRSTPLQGFYGEWIIPAEELSGHHMYVTNGEITFDFHGYARRQSLLEHHSRRWRARYENWNAEVTRIDFDLLDTRALNARKHRGPDQFWGDPVARAQRFLDRFNHETAFASAKKNAVPKDGVS